MKRTNKVLLLAPHTDDGELGCGGTLARMVMAGHQVKYVAFCAPQKNLERELERAMGILGIDDFSILDHKIRNFDRQRQDILDMLVGLNEDYVPDLVLLPSVHDMHQDHTVVYNEGLRAFRKTSILSYELPWNHLTFNTQAFIPLRVEHMKKKLQALKCYYTQRDRDYMAKDSIRSTARARGMQIGTKYAECFEVVRWIMNGRSFQL